MFNAEETRERSTRNKKEHIMGKEKKRKIFAAAMLAIRVLLVGLIVYLYVLGVGDVVAEQGTAQLVEALKVALGMALPLTLLSLSFVFKEYLLEKLKLN